MLTVTGAGKGRSGLLTRLAGILRTDLKECQRHDTGVPPSGLGVLDQDIQGKSSVSVTVYWRPGCPYCARLRRDLRVLGLPTWEVNIWADASAAAVVRGLAGGSETVPTVLIGDRGYVNPSAATVLAEARRVMPGFTPGAELARSGRRIRVLRTAAWALIAALIAASFAVDGAGIPRRAGTWTASPWPSTRPSDSPPPAWHGRDGPWGGECPAGRVAQDGLGVDPCRGEAVRAGHPQHPGIEQLAGRPGTGGDVDHPVAPAQLQGTGQTASERQAIGMVSLAQHQRHRLTGVGPPDISQLGG